MKTILEFEGFFETYTSQEIIGSGGSGRVYKITDKSGEVYAAKLLDPHKVTTQKLKRFKNELFFCMRNTDEHIIRIVDLGKVEVSGSRSPFYVMPFYARTLKSLIMENMTGVRILECFSQILDGVEAAHRQRVFHRDLKPENVLYDTSADRLVIADFGVAHFAEEYQAATVVTQEGERVANWGYAAPEQRTPGKPVDHRADIYALGLILNQMFTGEIPQGTKFKKIGDVQPEFAWLDELVDIMVRSSPDERHSSIAKVRAEIGRMAELAKAEQKVKDLSQKLSRQSEGDDSEPKTAVRVAGNEGYDGQVLTMVLSDTPSPEWISKFQSSYMYPTSFDGERVRIRIDNGQEVEHAARSLQASVDAVSNTVSFAMHVQKNVERERERIRLGSEKTRQERLAEINRKLKNI